MVSSQSTIAAILVVAALLLGGCPGKTCPSGLVDCDEVCVDLANDPDHCGACARSCPHGAACSQRSCECPSDKPDTCGNTCVDLKADAHHCGTCGHQCGLGACSAGACACDATPATVHQCAGASPECVDVSKDPLHCGDCSVACGGGKTCTASSCSCPATKPTECSGTCVDTTADVDHCGDCGKPCTRAGGVCKQGSCACPDTAADFCVAANACVDLQTNVNYCGACNTPCGRTNGACIGGSCVCPAGAPDYCSSYNRCVDLKADHDHCGTCAKSCGSREVCQEGLCCGEDGVICGQSCCKGNECCGSGCQLAHLNGLGGTFYDCSSLGTHTMENAKLAADAWEDAAVSDQTGFPCANTLCFQRQTANQCALWCDNGKVTASRAGSLTCLCPEQNPPTVGNWN
ncbi:MAG: hypothetical protein HY901_23830 [Deltaproteobacteria bacterium]|nr:hypothetical protein [Deltaproteobacteria bacterium]